MYRDTGAGDPRFENFRDQYNPTNTNYNFEM